MHVYFDMDGTIADFYGVEGWLESILDRDTRPYDIAAPIEGIERLAGLCAAYGATVGVISWLARDSSAAYDKAVTDAKRKWIADNFPWAEDIHIVKYGTPKSTVTDATSAVLLDDETPNCHEWASSAEGRYAIQARNIEQMERDLSRLLAAHSN